MHHHIDPLEPAFEEVLIGLELERVRQIPAAFASMPSAETMA
jgi:hypothetical protein